MRTQRVLCAAAAGVAMSVGSAAMADTFEFSALLSAANEVPPAPSSATGTFFAIFDDSTNTLSFEWSIQDLIGTPATPGAHIHNAAAGANGSVVFGFNQPGGSWPLEGSAVWSNMPPAMVTELFAGRLYANFHTTHVPSGEVRGQILLVPSPGVAGAGMAAFGLMALRRRR